MLEIFISTAYRDKIRTAIIDLPLEDSTSTKDLIAQRMNAVLMDAFSCRALTLQSGYPIDVPLTVTTEKSNIETKVKLFYGEEECTLQLTPLCDSRECYLPAIWVRKTQFSGMHHFCSEHALQQEGFSQHTDYFYWEAL